MATNESPRSADSRRKSRSNGPTSDDTLGAALQAARETPDAEEKWVHLEELVGESQRPDEVAALYREVLTSDLPPARAASLGSRAVHFHEEWFGEDSPQLVQVLTRVLEIDPAASDWAFERLTVVHTVAERWDDLLGLYDRMIARAKTDTQRARLLEEAAQCAKDFAAKPDRAIGYLEQLLALRPSDAQLAASLERLYERQERWLDLVAFWQQHLKQLSGKDASSVRLRIAQLFLQKLHEPGAALMELETALSQGADAAEVMPLLESIVSDERAGADVRKQAFTLVRQRYDADARPEAVVPLIDIMTLSVDAAERIPLHRDAAERLAGVGRAKDAMQHYTSLLHLDPFASDARVRLRALAEETGEFAAYVDALTIAGENATDTSQRATLWSEAAESRRTALRDVAGAVEMYQRVLKERNVAAELMRTAARRLADLYGETAKPNDRLQTLEKLAQLDLDPSERKSVLGTVARLADDLGESDRALAAWEGRLATEPHDMEALDAVVDLLERGERWKTLVPALRRRSKAPVAPAQRRSDLVRIAMLEQARLHALDDAITTWGEVAREFGVDTQVVDALAELFTHTARWRDLADTLDKAAVQENSHLATVLCRLGDVRREHLGEAEAAVRDYDRALAAAPGHEAALAGLRELLGSPSVRRVAIEKLAASYEQTEAWEQTLGLLEQRLSVLSESSSRAAVLREAARLYEKRGGDPTSALRARARSLVEMPLEAIDEPEVLRLAEVTGEWLDAVRALEKAAAVVGDAKRASDLHFRAGEIKERRLDDASGAVRSYAAALRNAPSRVDAAEALVRAAARGGEWTVVLEVLRSIRDREDASGVHLKLLADAERREPGRSLFDTLIRLANKNEDDLDPLYEAAELALGSLGDAELGLSTARRLYESSARLLRHGASAKGSRTPMEATLWAVSTVNKLYETRGEHEARVTLLTDAARLPLELETAQGLRREAARIADKQLKERARAIELYRAVLERSPNDDATLTALAELYRAEEEWPALLALRQHELRFAPTIDRRLALRLGIAELVGIIEVQGGRLESLRKNLDERPGHEASIRALYETLERQARYRELNDVLADQAARLETQGEAHRAADLWANVASLSEERLDDVDRAVGAHRKVVELAPTAHSLDALARIHTARNEHGTAAQWLERRLVIAGKEEQIEIALRLARGYLGANRRDRAISVLEKARAASPQNADLRALLAEQYRTTSAWRPLARLLEDATKYERDHEAVLGLVREVAHLYHQELGTPADAVPILTQGVQLVPDDRTLKTMLAEGLLAAGKLDEARTLLEKMVEDFGRRRSAERAAMHYRLARVAHAQGKLAHALEQLELATKMDMGNASALKLLGDLARETGELDRAERAYRGLLLIVRRRQPDDALDVGAAEVLYELSRLARERGDETTAKELLESALEAAAQSNAEVKRFKAAMLTRGEPELVLRALEMRLAAIEDPRARADVRRERADVLSGALGRGDEAFEALLDALNDAPEAIGVHDATAALARQLGQTARYATALSGLIDRMRRQEDADVVGELTLRLGDVNEADLGNLDAARELYHRAEEAGGEHQRRAWLGLARVAARGGDVEEQRRVLKRIVDANVSAETRADALYRLAEVELARPELRDEGVARLKAALEMDPQSERAAAILKAATSEGEEHERMLALYEQIARAANDDAMLLDFLERRALGNNGTLADLRETIERATAMGAGDRVTRLLERALDIARSSEGGASQARWAFLTLAERREQAGDVRGAAEALGEAGAGLEGEEALALQLRAAALAAMPGGDMPMAIGLYEKLRADDPTMPAVWRPLLRIYRELGDEETLSSLVHATLDALADSHLRNAVRMEWAKHLMSQSERQYEAVQVLRDILSEEPDSSEASRMLTELYERSGYSEELVEHLNQQLDVARDHQDLEAISSLSLRLGELLSKVRREDAMDVYRRALDWVPEDRAIIEALLALHTPDDDARDRAEARERLLRVEKGDRAAQLASALYDEWEALGDTRGMQRALELGLRAHPDDEAIRQRLEGWYRDRKEWANLATLLTEQASRMKDRAAAVARLREAASLRRDMLRDPAGAADVLRNALSIASGDAALLVELAELLVAGGDRDGALREMDAALAGEHPPSERLELLRLRAKLRLEGGDEAGALADLDQAYGIGGAAIAQDLIAALTRRVRSAASQGDRDTERAATLRLVDVLAEAGDADGARETLASLLARAPQDRDALLRLRDMDEKKGDWHAVIQTSSQLVTLETGKAQVEAVLRLADATRSAALPHEARAALELVHQAQPFEPQITERLRVLYEEVGAHRELADMLIAEAHHVEDPAKRFDLLTRAGDLLLNQAGDARAAIAPLEEAARLRPDDHETVLLLVDVYIGSEAYAEAGQLLESAISTHSRRRSPELSALQHRMARLAGASGDRSLELQWLSAALESDKNNGYAAAEIAQLAMELGEYDTALTALRAITLMKNEGPMSRAEAFLLQAKIAHRRGEGRRALLWARKAMSEDPNLAEASAFLKELGEE